MQEHRIGPGAHDTEDGGSAGGDDWVRGAVVDAAVDAVRGGGRAALDVRTVSVIAGVREEDVDRNFPTPESLVSATVTRWHERRVTALLPVANGQGTLAFLRALIDANQDEPRLVRLLIGTLVDGSDPAHPGHAYYQRQYASFHRALRVFIRDDLEHGRIPAGVQEKTAADSCIAVYEGVQLQAVLRQGFEPLPAFDRAAASLVCAWERESAGDGDGSAGAGARVVPSGAVPPRAVAPHATILRVLLPHVRVRDTAKTSPAADLYASAGDTLMLPAANSYALEAW